MREVIIMKTTKNVNGIYDNGNWKIRDNGEVIAEGRGIDDYIKAKEEIKANTTKNMLKNLQFNFQKTLDKQIKVWYANYSK